MNGQMKKLSTIIILAGLLLVVMFVFNGCKKKSEPAAPVESNEITSAVFEQTICPIMGEAINKDIYTEYKGKKVYFCCSGCAEKFKADPEKYIAKLPQFKD